MNGSFPLDGSPEDIKKWQNMYNEGSKKLKAVHNKERKRLENFWKKVDNYSWKNRGTYTFNGETHRSDNICLDSSTGC